MNSPSFLQPRKKVLLEIPAAVEGEGSALKQIVKSPDEMSNEWTNCLSGAFPQSGTMGTDPGTPPYQCLMKNLEIQSPVSSAPTLTPTKKSHFLTPKLSEGSVEKMVSSGELTSATSLKASPDLFHFGTPSTSANAQKTSIVCPRSSVPLFGHHEGSPFIHHRGSPFMSFSPVPGQDHKNTSSEACHQSAPLVGKSHHMSSPPRLMPLKLVDNNNNGSKPYDPSTAGNTMKRSPLVKSLDMDHSETFSPLNLDLEINTPVRKTHEQGFPQVPNIKLTPRSTPRRNQNGHPPLPSIKLTPRSTPRKRHFDQDNLMMELDICHPRIKLTPTHRKVSVDDNSATSQEANYNPFTSDVSMASVDPMISMELSVHNAHVQEMKHFPCTPQLATKKHRSLFDPNSADDSIQSLLRADAMVEVARARESLTDDEDSEIECDPDYVLCSPPSFGGHVKCPKRHSAETNAPGCDSFKLNKKPSFLPMPILHHSNSLTSVPSLLGIKHLQDDPEHSGEAKVTIPTENVGVDQFKTIGGNSSMCSLALSVDSVQFQCEAKRDLFTPPPIDVGGNKNGFHALSPPPLLPNSNPKPAHW
jgi:hypothetical protein